MYNPILMNLQKYRNHRLITLITIVTLLISIGHFLNLSYQRPSDDGIHYVAYAYNSLKFGIYSTSRSEKPSPNYRREPMYPVWLMTEMLIHPEIDLNTQDARCIVLVEGTCLEMINYLKIGNIVLLMATALLSGYFVFLHGKSIWVSGICYFLIAFSGSLGYFTSRFYSEPLATLLVVAASFALYQLTQKDFTRRRAFLCGLLLASLALTKAIFYYLVFLCCILLFIWWTFQSVGIKNTILRISFLLLGAFILIGTWNLRNYIQFNTFSLAGRAGLNLTLRANYNEISPEEYRALILMYAPWLKWVIKENNNYDRSAMRLKLRDFWSDAKMRRDRVKSELGLKDPELDDFLFKEAKGRILSNLGKHLALVLPLALRGSSPESGYGFNPKNARHETIGIRKFGIDVSKFFKSAKAVPNMIYITVFFGTFFYSIIFRKWGMAWFLLPSIYGFAMYSFFTNFQNRFNIPSIPIYDITLCLFGLKIYNVFKGQIFKRFGNNFCF